MSQSFQSVFSPCDPIQGFPFVSAVCVKAVPIKSMCPDQSVICVSCLSRSIKPVCPDPAQLAEFHSSQALSCPCRSCPDSARVYQFSPGSSV